MSKVLSLRLKDEQMERLQRMARDRGQTPSRTGSMLIEEALRMAEFPYIEFRNSPILRQAYIQGSRITAWWLEQLARAYDHDTEQIAAHLNWPMFKVQAGLAYARAFPEEIQAAITENESYEREQMSRGFPQREVIKFGEDRSDSDGGEVGAARDVAAATR